MVPLVCRKRKGLLPNKALQAELTISAQPFAKARSDLLLALNVLRRHRVSLSAAQQIRPWQFFCHRPLEEKKNSRGKSQDAASRRTTADAKVSGW